MGHSMRRHLTPFVILTALLSVFASGSLFAAQMCTQWSTMHTPNQWFDTEAAACGAAAGALTKGTYTVSSNGVSGGLCNFNTYIQGSSVNYGGSASLLTRQIECEPVCKAGTKKTLNFTAGYHATPATNVKLNPLVKADPFVKQLQKDGGATMCHGGCKVGVPPAADGDFWISQVAGTNGLYRSSADIETTSTSQPCSEATPDAVSSAATPPACPGTTGTVNGATVCLPSTTDSGIDMGGEATRGNPAAGPVDPNKTPADRAKGPGGAGNGSGPAGSNGGGASGGPATGSNNSAGGKGCNDGTKSPTPACSGKGTNDADGNVNKPGDGKEQQNCGAPGQPKCGIDETGTPDGKGAFDKANQGVDTGKDSWISEIDKWQQKKWDNFTWTFQLPSGCSPLALQGFNMTLDVCQFQPMIHDIMSLLWAAAAVFGCMTLVFRTNAGG